MQSAIGDTPLIKVKNINTGVCELFLKMENMNAGGSIKDRIATSMIDAAENDGKLKPGGTIIEATAGNTGISLAQVGAQRGYKVIIVIPDKVSKEKVAHLKQFGAEVIITSSKAPTSHPDNFKSVAAKISEENPSYYYADQFNNQANPLAHEQTTAPEIWRQMQQNIDAIILGAGSGGHLTGIGKFFASIKYELEIVLVDPKGSVLADIVNGTNCREDYSWKIEGIGHDYVPKTCNLAYASSAITVADASAFAAARLLYKKENILAGPSTGAMIAAALKFCRSQTSAKRVVSFVYDSGENYLSKMYSDAWIQEQGIVLDSDLMQEM
jgi:cystathionine beta-synthase